MVNTITKHVDDMDEKEYLKPGYNCLKPQRKILH